MYFSHTHITLLRDPPVMHHFSPTPQERPLLLLPTLIPPVPSLTHQALAAVSIVTLLFNYQFTQRPLRLRAL